MEDSRYFSTSSTAIGWAFVETHFGVVITGSFSTRFRIISKLALPDPMITPARTQIHCTFGFELRISPVSIRLSKCWLVCSFFTPKPPR